jgi:hypothetical protein
LIKKESKRHKVAEGLEKKVPAHNLDIIPRSHKQKEGRDGWSL